MGWPRNRSMIAEENCDGAADELFESIDRD